MNLAAGWLVQSAEVGRSLVDREALVLLGGDGDAGDSLVVQPTSQELPLVYYGQGPILGTRGGYVALQTGAFEVTFAEFSLHSVDADPLPPVTRRRQLHWQARLNRLLLEPVEVVFAARDLPDKSAVPAGRSHRDRRVTPSIRRRDEQP